MPLLSDKKHSDSVMQHDNLNRLVPAHDCAADLRAEPRTRVFLQATWFPVEFDLAGTTLNISRSGLMVDVGRPIEPGRFAHVSLDDAVFHRVRVVRCDGTRLGLRADNPLDMLEALNGLEHGDHIGELPRAVRVGFTASIRLLVSGQPRPVRVRNMSTRGMMIEPSENLAANQTLVVQICSGEAMEAHVRWCSGGRAGIRTTHPIELR